LWEGDAPPGERLDHYVRQEGGHQPHQGETPVGGAAEVSRAAIRAVAAAEAARPGVTRNQEEFARFLNDMHCIEAQYRYYNAKTRAAAGVLRYGYSHDLHDLEQALPLLEESLEHYRHLVALTDKTYREACSVHSSSRRIPFLGAPGRYTHWRDCLPAYERELATFQHNLTALRTSASLTAHADRAPLPGVMVKLASQPGEMFAVEPGAKLYTDSALVIQQIAPELRGLTGIRIPQGQATLARRSASPHIGRNGAGIQCRGHRLAVADVERLRRLARIDHQQHSLSLRRPERDVGKGIQAGGSDAHAPRPHEFGGVGHYIVGQIAAHHVAVDRDRSLAHAASAVVRVGDRKSVV